MVYGAAPLGLGVTRELATFLATFDDAQLPGDVIHAARRGILDWLGCALAGSPQPTVARLLAVLRTINPTGPAQVVGHAMKLAPLEAALANGQMGHVLDYDDTHMGGVVLHTSSPVLSALFALADMRRVSGRQLIAAYASGFEAGVRVGKGAPRHHDGGWHLTGTLGSLAAGAAAARLIGLAPQQMTYAIGLAATQAAGMQQNRGTMAKSFHAGKAAANGLLAALLAEGGIDSSAESIEGKLGFTRIYSTETAIERVCDGLGEVWEISRNGFKPYACGVVLHPLIDATLAARRQSGIVPEKVERIELTVNPIAVRITGIVEPGSGLQSKFSVAHSAAVSFIDGMAGIRQYADDRAAAPDVTDLRRKIVVTTDAALGRDEARARVTAVDGRHCDVHVPHASGTVENPMTDEALLAKFHANAAPVIGRESADRLAALIDRLDELDNVSPITALCAVTHANP